MLEFQNGSGSGNGDDGESSDGIPAGNRGQGSGNEGKSIRDWRAGRGAV